MIDSDRQMNDPQGGAGNTELPRGLATQRTGLEFGMTATILPFRRRRVTRECAIEGCAALTAERRCAEHQAQLDANLAEMSAQHRARMDACLCPWCTSEGAK